MKSINWSVAVAAIFLTAAAGSAMADRGHRHHHGGPRVHFGVVIGPSSYWGPWHYPSYSYYAPYYRPYPPIVIEQSAPPVYIQQAPPAPSTAQAAPAIEYWYYCADEKAYYPYVKECPAGWQKVLPTPPRSP